MRTKNLILLRATVVMRAMVVTAAIVLVQACEPQDRRPGLWVSGEVASTPSDWGFTNEHMEIFVETQTWYWLPHSVTTTVATSGGKVYVPSIYSEPTEFPGTKRWNKNIASNQNVRLKIGEDIFEMRAHHVTDPAEFEIGFQALADKYPFWSQAHDDESKRPPFVVIRMDPR